MRCSRELPVLLETIGTLKCVSLMQPLTQTLFRLFLSGRRETDTGCGWSRGSQNPRALHPPKDAVRAERQEV